MRFQPWVAVLAIALPSAAHAQDRPAPRPELVTKLFDCRRIADAGERVRCYDAQVAALEAAEQRRDVVVVDRAEIAKTRRSLFGLTLPKLKLFGGDETDADKPEFAAIETTVAGVRQAGGRWVFTLPDGAVWMQTDAAELSRTPRVGSAIRIRRGAVGSFLANVDGQIAIRVRRSN